MRESQALTGSAVRSQCRFRPLVAIPSPLRGIRLQSGHAATDVRANVLISHYQKISYDDAVASRAEARIETGSGLTYRRTEGVASRAEARPVVAWLGGGVASEAAAEVGIAACPCGPQFLAWLVG